MKKATTLLVVTLCLCSTLAGRAPAEQQPMRLTGMYRGVGPAQDSLLWQRTGRDLSFAPQWETEASHKSMPDTRCNDDGFKRQNSPVISLVGSSTFVATWSDPRHGFYCIYGQRFDINGNPLGNDFKVSDNLTEKWAFIGDMATDPSGNFVIVWDERRNESWDIFGQRFNAVGEPLGGNFKINYNTDESSQYNPRVAMNGSGNFVVVWQDYQSAYIHVYGQRYNSSGVPQGSNFRINDVDLSARAPAVAVDAAGNVMVVWDEGRDGLLYGWDIYGQIFDSSGERVGDNFRINDDLEYLRQDFPDVSANSDGEFMVVWLEGGRWNRLGAKRYSSPGVPDGTSFSISVDDTTTKKYHPHVALDADGNFVVGWADNQEWLNYDLYYQRYDYLNQPQGSNNKLNGDEQAYLDCWSITMDGPGNFFIAWSDGRIDNEYEHFYDPDIYCQRFNSSGEPQGDNVKLNSENPDHLQDEPSISVDGTGSFVLAWTDWRNKNVGGLLHSTDIFFMIYNLPYTSSSYSNWRANKDEIASGHQQNSPSCAGYGSKEVVTAWADLRELDWDIYVGRNLPFYGGAEYKVNEDISTGNWNPSIAADNSGNFIVVWTDARNGYPKFDIYAQRFNSADEPQGINFRVNEEPLWRHQDWASVDMNGGGDFIVVWEDWRLGSSPYIYGQRFNDLGEPQGSNFKINDQGVASEYHYYPDVAMDNFGNFVVAWQRYSDIYAQMYDYSGQRIGGNFLVSDETALDEAPPSVPGSLTPSEIVTGDYPYSSPRLGVDMDGNGNFVVAWSDYRNGDGDIYAQRYHFTGMVWGNNYRVNTDPGSAPQSTPDVAINDTCVYYAWLDSRVVEYDYVDVYSKVEYWSPRYLPGDANADDIVDVGDVVYLVDYLYRGGPQPSPLNAGDPNADCIINVGDVVYLQSYLYKGGPPPMLGCVE